MKVVSLDGTPIGNPHEPDEDVVTFLEEVKASILALMREPIE